MTARTFTEALRAAWEAGRAAETVWSEAAEYALRRGCEAPAPPEPDDDVTRILSGMEAVEPTKDVWNEAAAMLRKRAADYKDNAEHPSIKALRGAKPVWLALESAADECDRLRALSLPATREVPGEAGHWYHRDAVVRMLMGAAKEGGGNILAGISRHPITDAEAETIAEAQLSGVAGRIISTSPGTGGGSAVSTGPFCGDQAGLYVSPTPTPMRVAEAVREALVRGTLCQTCGGEGVVGIEGDPTGEDSEGCDDCDETGRIPVRDVKLDLPAILKALGSPTDEGATELREAEAAVIRWADSMMGGYDLEKFSEAERLRRDFGRESHCAFGLHAAVAKVKALRSPARGK